MKVSLQDMFPNLLKEPPMGWYQPESKKTAENLSQWFTPRPLARQLVTWAGVMPGELVLEPSAGDGAFVEALLEADASVIAQDIDPEMVRRLRKLDAGHKLMVEQADFMGPIGAYRHRAEQFQWIVLNPPYEDGQDLAHIERALQIAKAHGGSVLALVRSVALFGVDRYERIWSKYLPARVLVLPRRPSFLLAGEQKDGPRHDFCAVAWAPSDPIATKIEWASV